MSVIEAGTKCCERVPGAKLGWRREYKQCSRPATIERRGKFYCKQHDPMEREAKRQQKRQQLIVKDLAEASRRRFVAACEQAIRDIACGHNDPGGLARGILSKEFGE